jgi:hypothetical protein
LDPPFRLDELYQGNLRFADIVNFAVFITTLHYGRVDRFVYSAVVLPVDQYRYIDVAVGKVKPSGK